VTCALHEEFVSVNKKFIKIFIGLRVGQIARMVFILKTTNFVVGRV
jgi:hypothetical protein